MPPTTSDATCVLVLADTHLDGSSLAKMPPEVWALADGADVILHAGDVVDQAVLDALAARAPVHAVLGNNDRYLVDRLPEELEVVLGGVRLAMVHDSGATAGRTRRMARRFPDADVVVFGHSHQPVVETSEGPMLLNPGSPTHRRRQPVHTVGWLELEAGSVRRADIIEVGPLAAERELRG
ncbi:metallophosphoesterase family protein [Aquihabitans daechungensis]|uniref:metallophosphoesterase family protein n=1 Tax=Aquihabitans daechungensis TaxID=1052257 RepID=UPI003B9EB8A3